MALDIAQYSSTTDDIDKILKSKEGTRRFTREEAARLVEWHRSLLDDRRPFDLADEPIVRELSRLGLVAGAEAIDLVARVRQLRQPSPLAPSGQPRSGWPSALDIPAPGCDALVTSPPYSTGGPLEERVGADAIEISDGTELAGPSSASGLAAVGKTFSALALPNIGELSLGVGLGSIRTSPAFRLVYPPAEEHFSVVLGVPYLLDVNKATSNLLHFTNPIPRAPLEIKSSVIVSMNVTVGDADSFYLVDSSPDRSALIVVQAFGSVHLQLTSSTGRVATAKVQFLKHEQLANKTATPTLLREFTLAQELKLAVGTKWISTWVEVRLFVQRFYFAGVENVPVEERGGFAMIDLRSPTVPTQQIHPILAPGGPIRVSQIAMTFCPEEIIGN